MQLTADDEARGGVAMGFLTLVIVGSLALGALAYTFGTVVPPGQMGIRQITFGPFRGFSERALPSGYHWTVPFYSTVHLIPSTIQVLDVNQNDSGGSTPLEIQTTDGSSVDIDVSLLYRFNVEKSESRGGPDDLITKVGSVQEATNRIETASMNELRKSLGKLSTSEFYNPERREEEIQAAHKGMDERLAPFGIKVEAVLLRRYTYREERIDTAIFQKNLQDQEERLNAALSKLAEAKADLERVSAEWDAKIKTLRVKGDNTARVLRSEGDLFEAKKKAEGDLLVAKARADVERAKAGALASTAGANIYLGKELAPILGSLKGGIVSELDPYNLEAWMSRFGVAGGQK